MRIPVGVAAMGIAALAGVAGAAAGQGAQADAAAAHRAPAPGDTSWARVTYLSGASVYVNAGTTDGLVEGARLDVVRAGSVVAELAVAFISSTRSSCTVTRSTSDPLVGDSVRFIVPRPVVAATARDAGPAPASVARTPTRLRGRIGLRYLSVAPANGAGPGLAQPALDVRIDGQHLGGSPVGLAVDLRAQRSVQAAPGDATTARPDARSVTRVYQASLTWNPPGSPTRVTLGRQAAEAIATLGFVDGVAVDVAGRHVSAGAVAGTQPEPNALGFSADIREYAAYVQAHNGPGFGTPWSLTLGGVGTYDRGAINREFAYVRGTWTSRWLSFYGSQELDVNRGWRAAREHASTTPTSTFVVVQVTPSGWLSFNGGFDSRRNVWLYRDYVNPETSFDDAQRRGSWGGVTLSPHRHVRLSADTRITSGGVGGASQSNTFAASLTGLTPWHAGVRARTTLFTGDLTAGRLESASVDLQPTGGIHLSATAGRRVSSSSAAGATTTIAWTSLDGDIGLGRSIYVTASTSRETGASGGNVQTYVALSYRF
jgi:hypothetical protein